MARLYCATHGRACERGVKRRQPDIRREGESVLIVKGKLISGPWRCDDCNQFLKAGCSGPRNLASARLQSLHHSLRMISSASSRVNARSVSVSSAP